MVKKLMSHGIVRKDFKVRKKFDEKITFKELYEV